MKLLRSGFGDLQARADLRAIRDESLEQYADVSERLVAELVREYRARPSPNLHREIEAEVQRSIRLRGGVWRRGHWVAP